jgi:hypothetical protein
MSRLRFIGLVALLLLLTSGNVDAGEYRVLSEQSVIAVVTHKGGFASGAAHNHFIAASGYEVRLQFDVSDPLSTSFELECKATDLVVDDPGMRRKWHPRLRALEILEAPFKELSEKDREKIRQTMLDDKQLDVSAFPIISARSQAVAAESSKLGEVAFPFRIALRFQVHGQEVEAPVVARYELEGERLHVEAVGLFRFKDFGIKPYSAMLGAVKNKNEFHVYVSLVAVPAGE